jgi:hypothetical protein
MRKSWRPDRAFIERRNRAQLSAIACECGYALSAGAVRSYKKSELIECLLRHFANAHAASDPNPAQVNAREWLPCQRRFGSDPGILEVGNLNLTLAASRAVSSPLSSSP